MLSLVHGICVRRGAWAPRRAASFPSRGSRPGFLADSAGDVAVLFGLMAIVMFLMVGAAVDIGRWLHARADTLAALDAGVLAGGRQLQLNGSEEDALAAANEYYEANTAGRLTLKTDTLRFAVQNDGLAFGVEGAASIATPFLSLIGIEELPLLNLSGSEYSKAELAVGGNSKTNIEISMMLDVSGSMAGQKAEDMKEAAIDLVNIVVWSDQSQYTSKVALVPFSAQVRPTQSLYDLVADPAMTGTVLGPQYSCTTSKKKTTCKQKQFTRREPCVVERTGAQKYTDATPGSGQWITPFFAESSPSYDQCALGSTNEVMPLSNDKTELVDHINGLVTGGGTAGHLGTAWAWYMLSPEWNSVLAADSRPKAYGTADLLKIAILMTDGEYNTEYSVYGIADSESNAPSPSSAANGSSSTQAKALCDGMKAEGITVYTVGFDLGGNQSAINTLNYCATSPGHAYLAEDGDALKQAFRDIALKISALYLSQ